jgi:hypothetical protein
MHRKIIGISLTLTLLAALLPATGWAAPALQDGNLLANPGFEEPYEDINRGRRALGWQQWYEDTGHESPTVFRVEIELNPALVQQGRSSQHIGNRTYAWHGGMTQSLAVPAGTPLRFCAYGRVFVSNDDFEEVAGWSWDGFRSQMKVGIDPDGEGGWGDSGIVWSAEANPHTAWQQMCVEAQAAANGKVAVYTSNNFRASADGEGAIAYHVDAWWDNASLVATAPAATTAPTNPPPAAQPPAQQPPAQPAGCQTREDGSVVYVVQSGDTLGAIALACDSTVEEIQRLNGLSGALINVGQTLVVKGPTAPPTPTPQPTSETPTETATPEEVAAATDGEVCVEAFNDANANQTKDEGEQLLGGVGFTLSDASGPTASYVTSGLEPNAYCFGGLQPGSYTVDVRPPLGVASTTKVQWPVGLTGGMQFNIAYGGTRNANAAAPNVPDEASPAEPGASDTTGAESQAGGSTSDLGRVVMGGLGIVILLAAGFAGGLVLMRARR